MSRQEFEKFAVERRQKSGNNLAAKGADSALAARPARSDGDHLRSLVGAARAIRPPPT